MASPQDVLLALRAGTLSLDEAKLQLRAGATARAGVATPPPAAAPAGAEAAPRAPEPGSGRIAIVGMSGRYPGADDLDQFWRNLAAGVCSIREIPPSRWDVRRYFRPLPVQAGKIYCKWMGMLDDVAGFDPLFFGISPGEAELMDPQQRIFLQEAYRALEDAGCAGRSVDAARCGVYLGIMGNEYLTMLHERRAEAVNVTGNSFAIAAARLSYFLNLKGPALAVDTACSSSLVATHLARRALLDGEIDLAVVGGVTLYLSPLSYVGMCGAGMLSPDGQCRAFDDGANGFVPAEGAGAIVLKRLEDAERDLDAIYGVVAGSAINQDGRTNGITAPSMASQVAVEREAYDRSGVDPRDLGYVEMHGTGTKLGDPVELEALATVFRERGVERGRCAIGSLKTNIGHASAAAGVASVQKVLLALRHRQLPPSLNFRRPNEHFDLHGSPFRVVTALEPWEAPPGKPRRAAVSSFGFSGTNAHLVLEEYVPRSDRRTAPAGAGRPALVVLSARSEERLRAHAGRLADWVEAAGALDLAAFAHTLQIGREGLNHRAAFVAASREELLGALRGLGAGSTPPGVLTGQARKGREELALLEHDDDDVAALLAAWIEKGKLHKVAVLWLRGLDVDWRRVHAGAAPARLHLPAYPFLRQPCWLPDAPAPGAARGAPLHPLIHANDSDLFEQRYTSTFTGEEPFLRDHTVRGARVLPAAAILELARAAAARAARVGDAIRLEDVRFLAALPVAGGGVRVDVSLTANGTGAIAFEIRSRQPGGAGAGEGEGTLHAQGRVETAPPGEPPRVDLGVARAACRARVLTAAACYARFEAAGIDYGPSHRGIERIDVGEGEALASLAGLSADAADGFVLPPGLIDSALQAPVGLVEGASAGLPMPVAVQAVQVFGPCAEVRAVRVRQTPGVAAGEHRFDLDLCDADGLVRARLEGFTVRETAGGRSEAPEAAAEAIDGLATLAPIWDVIRLDSAARRPVPHGESILVVGGDEAARRAVETLLPGARGLAIPDEGIAPEALAERLRALGDRRHVLWLAPPEGERLDPDGLVAAQRRGVLGLFRLVKGLLAAGCGGRRLDLTAVTAGTQAVLGDGERVEPSHAGLHGLVGALAKEYPAWQVLLVDLDRWDPAAVPDLLSLPADPLGRTLARRGGAWHRRKLVRAAAPAPASSPYRDGGVYVVIGGAGGIGEVWTEHVVRRHRAQVIWLGRRALDAAIQARIDRLAVLGPAPVYLQADARDRVALEGAYQEIKQRFARIHGVVHAAIDLRDQGLAQMSEADFVAGLSAKVDVCARLAQLFRHDALDLVLFFSSAQSFQNAPGQGNYAAGCAFEDAFARRLAREWPCRVRTVNWGFWGEHGVVATPAHRERMARAGIGSLDPAEGMAALDALLAGPLPQLAFLKTTRPLVLEGVDGAERLERLPEVVPPALASLEPGLTLPGAEALSARAAGERTELDALIARLVATQLAELGADEEAIRSGRAASLVRHPHHRRWLDATVAMLRLDDPAAPPFARGPARDALLAEWEAAREAGSGDPGRQAELRLLDLTVRALPDVLAGRRAATDVLFPGSRLDAVEGLYRGNPIADAMNAAVAEAVAAHVRRRLDANPGARVRLLELGGGTGGTTSAVLPRLRPWRERIDAYCFTDLSPAFLQRAEAAWRAAHPFFETARLDAEQPPEAQGFARGAFDVVIAANVLHATRDVARTLRNVKGLLRRNGLLAAAEISAPTLFTHLTVGLLEGWWLAEDTERRLPGSPGLSREAWAAALAAEGFAPVLFPARAAEATGQQVILAESDGWLRRREVRAGTLPAPAPAAAPVAGAAAACPPAAAAGPTPTDASARAERFVRETVLGLLARTLKVDQDAFDLEDAFANYGVDSISGVQLVQGLNEALGIELTATDLFDHGSVRRLTDHVLVAHGEAVRARLPATATPAVAATAEPVRPATPEPRPPASSGPAPRAPRALLARAGAARAQAGAAHAPIAVIGMSGRFARSPDLDALWGHLAAGDDLVGRVSRFDLARLNAGRPHCDQGSFLEDIDCFDPLFFKIAAQEARYMDPQQRLFLEEAWKALEDAGYAGAATAGKACAVFVGCSGADYAGLFEGEPPPQAFWGNAGSIVPARIAYHLDLQGPAVAVDTACSSSLVAVHLACQSLWTGESELALAGGVFLQTTPYFYASAERAGMLSHGGRCHAFDDRADGFVPGEGVGAVVLKPLDAALADGDHVHGVIRGTGTNQDGATNGITAPSARSQELLERQVYGAFGIDPGRIQLVEAHGTGTRLGDPIEVDALTRAFRAFTDRVGGCALGSIKTNLGHAAAAAGIAGLLKVLLALRHRQLPPSLHFRSANPRVRLDGSPFYVNTTLRPWECAPGDVRRAAVSSFGFSGTNAHVVIEEPPPRARPRGAAAPAYLFPLSARTPEQLRALASGLARHLRARPEQELADVSFTLGVGRQHLEHRLCCVAADRGELADRLLAWCAGARDGKVLAGEVLPPDAPERRRLAEAGAAALARAGKGAAHAEALGEVAAAFVSGATLEAAVLFAGERRGRVPLPTHPFARERYWVPERGQGAARAGVGQRLHPLVGRNVSTLAEQRFTTRLTLDEPLVAQHRIGGRAILPGVAFLELARAAGALATRKPVHALREVAWVKPVVVPAEGIDVDVTLVPGDDGSVRFEVASGGPDGPAMHARGQLITAGVPGGELAALDLAAIAARCPASVDAGTCYGRLAGLGLDLGPALRSIVELRVGEGEVLATLALPEGLEAGAAAFALHPALMDGALQAGVGLELRSGSDFQLHVPYALQEVELLGEVPRRVVAHLVLTAEGEGRRADVTLADEVGRVVVRMKGFAARPVAGPLAPAARPARGALVLERIWEAEPLAPPAPRDGPRAVIVLGQDRALGERLRAEPGATVVRGIPGDAWGEVAVGAFTLRAEEEADHERLVAALGSPFDALTIALVAEPAPEGAPAEGVAAAARATALAALLGVRAARRLRPEARIEVVALAGDGAGAALSGLGRSLALELPRVTFKVVELAGPPGAEPRLATALEEVLAGAPETSEVARRDGARLRAAWREVEASPSGDGPWRTGGTYLVTGALGGIGRQVALHLARQARARLVLCSRRGPEAAAPLLGELAALGSEAIHVQADVAVRCDVERLVAEGRGRFGPLHGVLHAAGVLRDGRAVHKTREDVDAVLAAKVAGALLLDEATRSEPLDLFLAFSSAAAVLGNGGQCDYACANGQLDDLVRARAARAARGLRPGRSIAVGWPLWREGGMRLDEAGLARVRAASGLVPLETAEALALLDALAAGPSGHRLVLAGELGRIGGLVRRDAPARRAATGSALRGASGDRPADGAAGLQRELIRMAAGVVGLEEGRINPGRSLVDYGFDSLGFSTLAQQVGARFGIVVSPAAFFEFPTVRALAEHLLESWGERLGAAAGEAPLGAGASADPAPAPAEATAPDAPRRRFAPRAPEPEGARSGEREPVAIVGMAGVMPGAPDLEGFWEHLVAGHDLVTEVPRWRWEGAGFAEALAGAGEAGRALHGAFVEEIDRFDARFFGISAREAELMDPQQRVFLETVWRAVEDAGYRMSALAGTRTGLFVGTSTADYSDVVRASGVPIVGHMATGLAPSVLANRVSFLFDLRGPSEPVDTACSSALVALHRAVEAVGSGACELAIAGGVNALLTPSAFISFLKAGMLSPDGRCKTFDRRANGYVRGEGAGAVLLKPLRRALADGDHVHAVIRATVVGHGGRASSLTAPSMTGQAEVLVEAYERAGVHPATVGYIEAHGTGTALGDPIEIDGLKRAFRELYRRRGERPRPETCGVGSVKTNVGHLEAAAGMAGLLKVLLALRHGVLPPSIHFEALNPHIELQGSPFHVVAERRAWTPARDEVGRPLPRRAGVSSFGFGGANAHVVLEEAPAGARSAAAAGPELVVLSARSEERLRASAGRLLAHLDSAAAGKAGGAAPGLSEVAHTLQVGREPLEHRLAVVAGSLDVLRERLRGFCAGRCEGVALGCAEEPPREGAAGAVARALEVPDLDALGRLWAVGAAVDFGRVRRGERPRRIPLPTYPFARDRHWLEPACHRSAAAGIGPAAAPEPAGDAPGWRTRLDAAGPARRAVLEAYLVERIARMLKLGSDERLDPSRPLVAVGFDSLMALQLKKQVQTELALDVSLVRLLGGESTAELAALLLEGEASAREAAGAGREEQVAAAEEVLEGVL